MIVSILIIVGFLILTIWIVTLHFRISAVEDTVESQEVAMTTAINSMQTNLDITKVLLDSMYVQKDAYDKLKLDFGTLESAMVEFVKTITEIITGESYSPIASTEKIDKDKLN